MIGICALGEIYPETFEVIEYLEGPRISGFTTRGFTDSGIIALATDRFRASHNRVEDNAGYGDAGLYVGGEQDVRARVYANTT